MSDVGREQVLTGQVAPFRWDSGRSVRYEVAVEALNRAIGSTSADARAARSRGDNQTAATLSARVRDLVRQQEHLHPDDVAAVEAAIVDGYGLTPRQVS